MPTVLAHVEVKTELPAYATCTKCRRTYRPHTQEQADRGLCHRCFEDVKYPHEPVPTAHVTACPGPRKPDAKR